MWRRAYVRLGRFAGPLALLGLRLYTVVTRLPRVRVVVMNEHDEILLVRGIISHLGYWTLPGGGVNRGEALAAAASRELQEETGIKKPAAAFTYMRTVDKKESGLNYVAPLFCITVGENELPKKLFNPQEIADIGWFKIDELPEDTVPLVSLAIAEYAPRNAHQKHR